MTLPISFTVISSLGRPRLCELSTVLRCGTEHYLVEFITDFGGMPQAQGEHRAILEYEDESSLPR